MKYTPLHVHSEYSLLDGLSKTEDIVERIQEIGADACALTDHGSISGAIDFSKALSEADIKPILGCEFYISRFDAKNKDAENRILDHQVILAKNEKGWKDLLSLVSISNSKDHFYYKPRIDLDILKQFASKGNLISFSGHLGSVLASTILEDNKLKSDWLEKGCYMANLMSLIFGKDNFFIVCTAIVIFIKTSCRKKVNKKIIFIIYL